MRSKVTGVVLRLRYVILLVVTVGVGWRTYELRPSDFLYFEYFGRTALGRPHFDAGARSLLHIYVDVTGLQVGPPGLLLGVPFQWLKPLVANEAAALFMMACLSPCLYLVERVARLTGVAQRRAATLCFIAGLAMVPMWRSLSVRYMHLDDIVVLFLVLTATIQVLKGRWFLTALALGTATATKPWAVAVLPILFVLPRPVIWKAGLAWIASFMAWWLPFVIAAPTTFVGLGASRYPVQNGSTWYLLRVDGHAGCEGACTGFAYAWMRPFLLALSFLIAAAVVRRGRWLAAPLAGLLGRVLSDAQVWPYYGVGPVLMAVLCDALAGRRLPVVGALVTVAEYSYIVLPNPYVQAAVRVVICGSLIGWNLRPVRPDEESDLDGAARVRGQHAPADELLGECGG